MLCFQVTIFREWHICPVLTILPYISWVLCYVFLCYVTYQCSVYTPRLKMIWPRHKVLFPSVNMDLAVLCFDWLYYNFWFAQAVGYSLYTGCRDNCIPSSSCLWNILTFPCVCSGSVQFLNKYLAFPWEKVQELLPGMRLSSCLSFLQHIELWNHRGFGGCGRGGGGVGFGFRQRRGIPNWSSNSLHPPSSVFCYLLAKDFQFSGQIEKSPFSKGGTEAVPVFIEIFC